MTLKPPFICGSLVMALFLFCTVVSASSKHTTHAHDTAVMTFSFGGIDFFHRWSKDGQNEFTPRGDEDLLAWRNMVTINVFETVTNGDQLAAVANGVLSNYQDHGKVIRTASKPRTSDSPAEHLIVAIFGDSTSLEAAFARLILIDGTGFVAVYSHRVYGKQAGPEMSDWLMANGQKVEQTLMAWDNLPALAALKQLPQSEDAKGDG